MGHWVPHLLLGFLLSGDSHHSTINVVCYQTCNDITSTWYLFHLSNSDISTILSRCHRSTVIPKHQYCSLQDPAPNKNENHASIHNDLHVCQISIFLNVAIRYFSKYIFRIIIFSVRCKLIDEVGQSLLFFYDWDIGWYMKNFTLVVYPSI